MTQVPSQQPSRSPCALAFVAEAPGDEEVEGGAPLIGPSGRLFNSILRSAGIERDDCFVGNVFNERLPDNEVAAWCAPAEEAKAGGFADLPPIYGKGYLRPERRWHLERLRTELVAASPTVIVPLGATALWAFTGSDNITQMRGAVSPASLILPGHKLVPTFHPAHVLRMWKLLVIAVGDVIKAAKEAERGPQIIHPKRELHLEPLLSDLHNWTPEIHAAELLSVDIETGWGQITCIGFAPSAERAICIPFVDLRKPNRSYWEEAKNELEAWGFVADWLESPTPKLGQNFTYDQFWLLDKMGIRVNNYRHDTRLLHHALYPELPKDLAFLSSAYGTQSPWKQWGAKSMRGKRDD